MPVVRKTATARTCGPWGPGGCLDYKVDCGGRKFGTIIFQFAFSDSVSPARLENTACEPAGPPVTSVYCFNRNRDHFDLFAHFACPLLSHPLSLSLWLWFESDKRPYNLRKMPYSLLLRALECPSSSHGLMQVSQPHTADIGLARPSSWGLSHAASLTSTIRYQ